MAALKKERLKKRIWESEEWRRSLYDAFSMVDDWRDNRGKRHKLVDIMIMALYGILWGFSDFTNMCIELSYHKQYFTKLLGLEHGIPSHDCFSAVFRALPAQEFLGRFTEWIGEIYTSRGKHIAIDGKAVRAACAKSHGENMPYILNAYLVDEKVLCSQMKIPCKKNEISSIPQLLDYLDLNNAVVTIDAIGAQTAIADKIVQKGGAYVLPVKLNQPSLQDCIAGFFDDPDGEDLVKITSCSSLTKDHGRIDIRDVYYSEDVSCLAALPGWASVRAIGKLHRQRTVIAYKPDKDGNLLPDDKISDEIVCYVMSDRIGAEAFGAYVRSHWQIEILHYELDLFYAEDRCTASKEFASENLSLMRKIVFNLTKLDPAVAGMTTRRRQLFYYHDMDFSENLIFGIIPSEWDKQRNS